MIFVHGRILGINLVAQRLLGSSCQLHYWSEKLGFFSSIELLCLSSSSTSALNHLPFFYQRWTEMISAVTMMAGLDTMRYPLNPHTLKGISLTITCSGSSRISRAIHLKLTSLKKNNNNPKLKVKLIVGFR